MQQLISSNTTKREQIGLLKIDLSSQKNQVEQLKALLDARPECDHNHFHDNIAELNQQVGVVEERVIYFDFKMYIQKTLS